MTLRNSTRRRLLRGSLYPSTGVTVADVVLLVDSGADVTLLPRQAVERLGIGLATGRGYEISGFDGTKESRENKLTVIFSGGDRSRNSNRR